MSERERVRGRKRERERPGKGTLVNFNLAIRFVLPELKELITIGLFPFSDISTLFSLKFVLNSGN